MVTQFVATRTPIDRYSLWSTQPGTPRVSAWARAARLHAPSMYWPRAGQHSSRTLEINYVFNESPAATPKAIIDYSNVNISFGAITTAANNFSAASRGPSDVCAICGAIATTSLRRSSYS
jgi:hypothetical protein